MDRIERCHPPILELPLLLLFLKEDLEGSPAGSKASRHVLEVPRRNGGQRNLAVSRLEVEPHGRALLRRSEAPASQRRALPRERRKLRPPLVQNGGRSAQRVMERRHAGIYYIPLPEESLTAL